MRIVPRTLVGKLLSFKLKKNCGHALGVCVPSTFPIEAVRGCGGLRRRFPVGGFAKGIPLKVSTPRNDFPTTVAPGEGAMTVGDALLSSGSAAGAANAEDTREKKMASFIVNGNGPEAHRYT